MTQSRWMPIGVLALLLGAVPANAQNGLTQLGSTLAIGQESQDEPKCPCCVDLECCENPITFLNRIVANWFGRKTTTVAAADVPKCAGSSCRTGLGEITICPAPTGATTNCVECPWASVLSATGCTPIACGVGAACTTAATCADVCPCSAKPTAAACCSDACCGANCKCCDTCKCKKVSKCQCCKNCECKSCGASAPVVFRCPFLSQVHIQSGHPMIGRGVQVIHQGIRHPMTPSPVLFGQLPPGHHWPVITEFHPPIPIAGHGPVYPCPMAGGNCPQPPPMPMAVHTPFQPGVHPAIPHPGRLVVHARTPLASTETAVRIHATPNGVIVEGSGLKARCNRISYNGKADVVEMEGNVQVEYRRGNRSAKIVAERVVVHLREGSFEVTPAPTTRAVVPTAHYETVDTPEMLPRPTPVYTQPRRFGVEYPTPRTSPIPSDYDTRTNSVSPTPLTR